MSKLPPPYVDGSIPAQTDVGLEIPFRLNRAVSLRDVTKIFLKIKTVATDRIIGVFETAVYQNLKMIIYILHLLILHMTIRVNVY